MRIDLNTHAAEIATTSRNERVQGGSIARAEVTETRSAQESSFRSRLQLLQAAVMSAPELRQDRVERLARALREGTYQVDSEQTANAMLAESGAA